MTRLLSINNYYYARGGADVVFFEHTRLLREAGWDVAEFSMHHPDNLSSQWSQFFVDEIEFEKDLPLVEKMTKGLKSVYSFEAKDKIDKLIRHHKPSHAHAHNIYHHLSPAILPALKRHGVKTYVTLHDLKIACPAYKMLNSSGVCEQCKGGKLRNVVLNRCMKGNLALSGLVWFEATLHKLLGSYTECVDRFVVPSQFFLEKFVEWGWPREKFVYIPNFIDCDLYQPDYTPGERFLYFGRLSEEKGLNTLFAAAAKAGVKLSIVGTGPLDAALKQQAAQHNIDVEFLGYQTGDALKQAVTAARAVIIPSEWYENAPMSVLEAEALGKPIIGAQIGGIPELVQPDITGALFPSGDADALADVLTTFASMSDDQLETLGRNGRQQIEERFTAERYTASILDLYK